MQKGRKGHAKALQQKPKTHDKGHANGVQSLRTTTKAMHKLQGACKGHAKPARNPSISAAAAIAEAATISVAAAISGGNAHDRKTATAYPPRAKPGSGAYNPGPGKPW
jgi:hypothetical protein